MLRVSAIDAKNELEEFLFTWTALEFLIKGIYSHYYKVSFAALATASGISRVDLLRAILAPRRFDTRENGMSFKFLASVYILDKSRLTEIFDHFDPLRKFRNEAFHEASISDLQGNIIRTRSLLLDMLRLHRGV